MATMTFDRGDERQLSDLARSVVAVVASHDGYTGMQLRAITEIDEYEFDAGLSEAYSAGAVFNRSPPGRELQQVTWHPAPTRV